MVVSHLRPKLVPEGSPFQDFVIRKEEGFPGFVNLLGIESPGSLLLQGAYEYDILIVVYTGLTSSPAIARMVEDILYGEHNGNDDKT